MPLSASVARRAATAVLTKRPPAHRAGTTRKLRFYAAFSMVSAPGAFTTASASSTVWANGCRGVRSSAQLLRPLLPARSVELDGARVRRLFVNAIRHAAKCLGDACARVARGECAATLRPARVLACGGRPASTDRSARHAVSPRSFRPAGDPARPGERHASARAYRADFGSRAICSAFVSAVFACAGLLPRRIVCATAAAQRPARTERFPCHSRTSSPGAGH
jgi:hypothetical protein